MASQNLAPTSSTPFPDTFTQSILPTQQLQQSQMPTPQTWMLPPPQLQQVQGTSQGPQQRPMYSSVQWANFPQMGNPQMTSGMNGMLNAMGIGGFGPSLLPQHLLFEAMNMSAPIGETDEELLIEHLIASHTSGQTYKTALNSLHGRNNHSMSIWKDYYLEHKERLDNIISKKRAQSPEKVASPSIASPSSSRLPTAYKKAKSHLIDNSCPSPVSIAKKHTTKVPTSKTSTKPVKKEQTKVATTAFSWPGTGRQSINSLTTFTPIFDKNLPAPHAALVIPDPPSRSPTPPTRISRKGLINRFTDEDKAYFLNFISWRLEQDPTLTRAELMNLIAEKAPQHTVSSWTSYWSNNHDLPDKILGAAKGYQGPSSTSTVKHQGKPSYKDISSSSDHDNSEGSDEESVEEADLEEEDSDVPSYSESEMGNTGEALTDADLVIFSRHLASIRGYKDDISRAIQSFVDKHDQRTAHSWAQHYRRHMKYIDRTVRKVHRSGFNPSRKRKILENTENDRRQRQQR